MFSKKTQELVRAVLERIPEAKDDDWRLCANVWVQSLKSKGQDLNNMSAKDFLLFFAHGNLPQPESISRTRRKLQEAHPELRGEKYQERQEKTELEVRQMMRRSY